MSESVTPELLLSSDFAVTRELVRCVECEHRVTLEEARKAANLPIDNAMWEDTDQQIKKPIVCPECKNQEWFVRDVFRLTETAEYVKIEDGEATVNENTGDPLQIDEVRMRYRCAVTDCDGVIELRTGNYVLARDV